MSAADTGSLYFECVPLALRDVMWRVGAPVRPAEFIEAVVEAWRAVEMVSEGEVQARFRACRPYREFQALLGRAGRGRVLAVGCGRSLGGRSAAYAASVIREVLPAADIAVLDRLDLSHGTAPDARSYDLVVSHSLLHFVHDPAPVCRVLRRMIAPGGAYLMANEPNSRFWTNPECVRAMTRVADAEARGKRLRRWTSPSRYWSHLRRLGRFSEPCDATQKVNALLRDRLRLTGDLSPKEIVRIIDPNLPDTYPGKCAIGSDGLSWAQLESGPLSELRLEMVRTCGYVMRSNPEQLPEELRRIDEELARRYPLDGLAFSALWRRPA